MMKKFSLSLLILITLISCEYGSVQLLDEDDLAWMEAYENGDTVLFASTEGMDTMFVSKNIDNNPYLRLGIYCFSDYYGHAIYKDTIVHHQEKISQSFSIRPTYNNKLQLNFIFHKRFCIERLQLPKVKKVKLQDFEIGDLVYHDCIIIDSLYSQVSRMSELNCDYFVWSKSKGLIQYKYQSGETYNLYKILPHQKRKH